jgi:hypothetical protein
MTTTIEDANELLRAAVEMRRDAQAAGKPHEEWYDTMQAKGGATAEDIIERFGNTSHPTTEPRHIDASTEETQHIVQALNDWATARREFHERERNDEQQPGSLPFLELLEELRSLHLSKSQDYGSESDPLANIRQGAEFVGIEAWRGCMVRVADKVQRLKTYCRTGRLVHEGVRDTLLDLAAYSLLAIVLFDEGRESSNGVR